MSTSIRRRKARPLPSDWAAGDSANYLGYRQAWARIRLARRSGFFLEAVAIEESILSDRLCAYLEKTCGVAMTERTKRSAHA